MTKTLTKTPAEHLTKGSRQFQLIVDVHFAAIVL